MTDSLLPAQTTSGNWPEDFPHENGNYLHECAQCNSPFTGHKRRSLCKSCSFDNLKQAVVRSGMEPGPCVGCKEIVVYPIRTEPICEACGRGRKKP